MMKALNNSIELKFDRIGHGVGWYTIYAEVLYDVNKQTFTKLTNDSEWLDNYNKKADGASYDELQQMYYDKFMDLFVDDIIMWMYEIEFGEPFDKGE